METRLSSPGLVGGKTELGEIIFTFVADVVVELWTHCSATTELSPDADSCCNKKTNKNSTFPLLHFIVRSHLCT